MAASESVDPSVDFLYRDRDPKKRRVKPVQKHLIQVDFGDDSEEDSDFKVEPNSGSEDDEIVASESDQEKERESEGEDEKGGGEDDDADADDDEGDDDEAMDSESASGEDSDESEEDDNDQGSESESDSSEGGGKLQDMLNPVTWGDDDSEDDADYVPPQRSENNEKSSKASKKTKALAAVPHRREDIKITGEFISSPPGKRLKVVICCVCLGDISVEEDEIVECDGCGVSVHEGCYGISENQSNASTESSASTEPWFCDACKAGVEQPHCELCPNSGGIFKETDAGRWVHIVCALYIPGVAFGDVDKLSPVTLFEMPYSRWGAKECTLCEDHKFSRTGVCVGCDAGMCRTHFHVTCAQREGLLSEASPDEDIADPFYAYCKQHVEKHISRRKRCNWLAIQRNVKNHPKLEIEDEKEKDRVQRKLRRHCRKYVEAKAKKPPSWTPTEKMPRLLSTCPSALRRLNKKAELLGINTQVEHQSTITKDTRKKVYVSPAFSVEYVTYFVERNNKITNMRAHTTDLQQQNWKLKEQETILRAKYDQLSNDLSGLRNSNNKLRQDGESIWKILSDMSQKPLLLPDVLKVKKLTVQTSVPKNPAKKDGPISPNLGVILHKCSLCHKTSDQHMLARCDKCRLYYHLGCLDPPLTRMPKKTRQCGWQCSECAKSSSEESEDKDVDPDAPRKLRETIKEPLKFTPEQERRVRGLLDVCKPKQKGKRKVKVHDESDDDSDMDEPLAKKKKDAQKKEKDTKAVKRKRVKQKAPVKEKEEEEKSKEKTTQKKEEATGSVAPKRKRKPQVQASYLLSTQQLKAPMECVICLKPGDTTNMVRCDECTLCYHYGCLDPPLTKSPKRRGYSWHCAACDPNGKGESSYPGKRFEESDEDEGEEKPKRKRVKKMPHGGKQSEEKNGKKKEGVKTRCRRKEGGKTKVEGENEGKSDSKEAEAKGTSKGKETEAKGNAKGKETEAKGITKGKETEAKGIAKGTETEAKGIAKGKEAEAKGSAKGKETEAKGMAKGKETEAKGNAKGKEAEAKGSAKGKEAEAKGIAKGKETEAKGIAKGKETEAKGIAKGTETEAKGIAKGKETEAKSSSKGKEIDAKGNMKETEGDNGKSKQIDGKTGAKAKETEGKPVTRASMGQSPVKTPGKGTGEGKSGLEGESSKGKSPMGKKLGELGKNGVSRVCKEVKVVVNRDLGNLAASLIEEGKVLKTDEQGKVRKCSEGVEGVKGKKDSEGVGTRVEGAKVDSIVVKSEKGISEGTSGKGEACDPTREVTVKIEGVCTRGVTKTDVGTKVGSAVKSEGAITGEVTVKIEGVCTRGVTKTDVSTKVGSAAKSEGAATRGRATSGEKGAGSRSGSEDKILPQDLSMNSRVKSEASPTKEKMPQDLSMNTRAKSEASPAKEELSMNTRAKSEASPAKEKVPQDSAMNTRAKSEASPVKEKISPDLSMNTRAKSEASPAKEKLPQDLSMNTRAIKSETSPVREKLPQDFSMNTRAKSEASPAKEKLSPDLSMNTRAKSEASPAKEKVPQDFSMNTRAKSVSPAKEKLPQDLSMNTRAKSEATPAKEKLPQDLSMNTRAKSVSPAKEKVTETVKQETTIKKEPSSPKRESPVQKRDSPGK